MIDLSHLTEEEQEAIMTVLSRDAELKRAEEERIRKLENVLNTGIQQPDSNLKYFTGEWFYEAKSRRHMDKIHGSEIILASIKRRKSAQDGSLRLERSKSPSSQASDLIPPPKPARSWDAFQPQEMNPTEKDALQIRSPRTPRHNPFNRASLLVVEPPENTVDISNGAVQQCQAGSVTSDASSAGFRPVPKKRTFLSRRTSTTQGPETLGPPAGMVPAPRRSLQNGSSGSSNQSNVKTQNNINTNADAISPKQVEELSQACSRSSLEGDTPAQQQNRASPYITRDREVENGQDNLTQRQPIATETVAPLSSGSILHSDAENISSVGSASRQEFSFTQSSVAAEPPVSYDLNFIDKSDQQVQAKAKQELRLSTQATSPTGDEDDAITKVLDWFSRSSDSSDWLNNDDDENITKTSKDVQNPPSRDADPDTGKSHVSQEIHKEMKQDSQATALPQGEGNNEIQQAKISHLKSFWEKSNTGPKILISKSISSSDKDSMTNKDETHGDTLSTTATHNDMGVHKDAPDHNEDTDKLPQNDPCKNPDASESIIIFGANNTHQKETHSVLESLPAPEIQLEKLSPTSSVAPTVQTVENKRIPESQVQAKDNLESDKLVHLKDNGQISPKVQTRSSNEDMNKRNCGDRSPKSVPIKERSPVLNRHVGNQDAPLKDKERIKHLKSFWEQERAKTGYNVKSRVDNKVPSAKLNKRYAKSEFDLQLIGKGSDSEEDTRPLQQSNQKADKSSPSLGRRQFNSLREFWDEAMMESKSCISDKPKSPKCKELPSHEIKCGDPESNNEKPSSRPAPPPYRPRLPLDKQTGSRLESKPNHLNNHTTADIVSQREARRSSKDSGKSPKARKDSFSTSSSRMNSFRRAKSMFSLSTDEADPIQIAVSPVHSQSRKPRSNTDKGTGLRRHSEDTETLTPRARAFVPTDYRHYLGMTDKSSANTSLVPALQDKWPKDVKSEHDNSRRGSRTQQRPLSPNYSSSDTCQESSSASESRSNSRLSSNRENDNDSPVRRALRRAEARPKNLAKSLEDITATSTPRTERRQELCVDQRSSSDGSSLPSPMSSLFMDPEHMKKMSKSVPSFLQKELSGSVMTMYSGDFGSVDVQGTIHFSIHYVQKLREFHIFVAQCKDLAPVDPKRGRSDPYVKSYLVPDKANLGKRKTSVKKKTLNPIFNEILRYRVRMEYLRTQTLILSVWHHDTFGKNSFLGEIDMDLSKWDFDHTQMNYLALKARSYPSLTPPNCRGEMRLAIRYVPQISHSDGLAKVGPNSGEIHIWVKECKNLTLVRATIDPYVKCCVLPDTSKKSRQKTRVLRGTSDPVFNHTMVYDGIRQADLTEACVELTVLDRDKLATNLLGGLRLGAGTGRSYGSLVDWMDSTAYEVAFWDRMVASPNEWVEDVLPLRWIHSTKNTLK